MASALYSRLAHARTSGFVFSMLSAQLFYFLGVVFLLAGSTAPEQPWLAAPVALFGYLAGFLLQFVFSQRVYARAHEREAYFRTERSTFSFAFVLFLFFLYGLDLKYYLKPLALSGSSQGLADLAGLLVFFALLALSWLSGRARYQVLFYERISRRAFLLRQLKQNLPLVLPWVAVVAGLDLLRFILPAAVLDLVPAPWSNLLVFLFFIALLIFFLPPLIRRLWNCRPIPPGPLRESIAAFCREQRFRAGLYFWPYLGGHALTAGILGILPGLRYLLFTPALTMTLSEDELKSVIAHEIGHVRHHHLFWYMALFFAFSLVLMALAPLLSLALTASSLFPALASLLPLPAATVADAVTALPLLALVLLYFRFIFGFFLRNFERQADAHVFSALGGADALISSFRTIGAASGGKREKHNWHHFSLDERVAFLRRCREGPGLVSAHQRRLRRALAAYFAILAGIGLLALQPDRETLAARAEIQYIETVLRQEAGQKPEEGRALILLGDFYLGKKMEVQALAAYNEALARAPKNASLLNNLAWLLLTADTSGLRDKERGLALAEQAAGLAEKAFILDTLATAYWAHGRIERALALEEEAARLDADNHSYYQQQQQRFRTQRWRADAANK